MNYHTFSQYALALICLSLCLSACKKDEDEAEVPAPTKTEILASNNWQISAYSVEPAIDFDQNGTQENNLLPYLDACNLDDFIDMNIDRTYTGEEGASKCSPNDPQVFETGDWSFNSDETLIVFSPDGQSSYEYEIKGLSSNRLEVEQVVVSNGVTYTFSIVFD